MKRFIAAICASALIISAVPVMANPSLGDVTKIEGVDAIDDVKAYGLNSTVIEMVNSDTESITPSEAAEKDKLNGVEPVEGSDFTDLENWSYISQFGQMEAVSGDTVTFNLQDALNMSEDEFNAGKYGVELRDKDGNKADVYVSLENGVLKFVVPEGISSPFAFAFMQWTGNAA